MALGLRTRHARAWKMNGPDELEQRVEGNLEQFYILANNGKKKPEQQWRLPLRLLVLASYIFQGEDSVGQAIELACSTEIQINVNVYYTTTEDDAQAVIGQYLLIIISVNHMENVVIILVVNKD